MNVRKIFLAEFIGTFLLVFAGTGAIVINRLTGLLTHIGVALTFGLIVMVMIYAFGHISGAHFNPAVTVVFWLRGDIKAKTMMGYIGSQVAGALLASLVLLGLFGNVAHLGTTLPNGSWEQTFLLELILTFSLMLVILVSAVHGKAVKEFAGVAIGGIVGIEAMFAGPISGASMNPARSLAPAVVSGTLDYLWVYIVATVSGALLAGFVYRFLHE